MWAGPARTWPFTSTPASRATGTPASSSSATRCRAGSGGRSSGSRTSPSSQGRTPRICISFDAQGLTVALGVQRLGLEAIEFFSVKGDFRVKSIKLK
ncbi:unnamed protein product [Eretmochelys imbricata]